MSIGGYFAEMVQSGALLIAAPLAMTAGLGSFISPCILPLVPVHLGCVSGLADPSRLDNRCQTGSHGHPGQGRRQQELHRRRRLGLRIRPGRPGQTGPTGWPAL
ncbi:hypothetical protein AC20117_20850 [Arthrobacter crystallopoietes]|nr:hypothetical protein AC20117_20850 [Arthrobacter crystallopoietes]